MAVRFDELGYLPVVAGSALAIGLLALARMVQLVDDAIVDLGDVDDVTTLGA